MKNSVYILILFACIYTSISAQPEKPDSLNTIKSIEPHSRQSEEYNYNWEASETPGNYIIKSSELRLLSIELGLLTTTLYAVGAFRNISTKGINTIFFATGIVCLGLNIGGEFCLIKAGKLMNKERVTISSASEGIGLAINF